MFVSTTRSPTSIIDTLTPTSEKRGRPRKLIQQADPIAATTIHLEMVSVPLSAIFAAREQYENYPEFQREFVWKRSMQQLLVDTALRRFPMPPLLAYREPVEMGHTFWIIDGKQRLTSLLHYLAGEFPTLTEAGLKYAEPNSPLPLIEPGKKYGRLERPYQRLLLNYPIQFVVMENIADEWLSVVFSRLQYHTALTVGEMLWAKNTKTTQAVQEIYEHPFWYSVYNGKDERMERLVEGLSVIAMELFPFPVNLRRPELLRIASGIYDDRITASLLSTITTRLERLTHVFAGAGATARTDIIPIYQAGLFLEERGYDLLASEEGCLGEWFKRAKYGSLHGMTAIPRRELEFNVCAHMPQQTVQKHFWEQQLGVITESVPGLVKSLSSSQLLLVGR